MSNVYILEPPTSGKVLLKTTVGDIDIELWSKETPKTCRNFIQLCLEGYYNGTVFHRVVKGFIAQGGDPNGDGTGGESIYDEPFKDEFHQRLKFVRRGLVAMANAGKDDNGSQFFFTLAATPELQNKHTIFGKVTGETLFNMLKLEEGLIKNERPEYPHKILKTEVLNNPFTDIILRVKEVREEIFHKKEKKRKGVKNFKLLSFGQEAEEDEEETTKENEKYLGKSKSTHDVLEDPKLNSEVKEKQKYRDKKEDDSDIDEHDDDREEIDPELQLENIRKKLKTEHKIYHVKSSLNQEAIEEKKKKLEEVRKEIANVKREYHKNKLQKEKKAEEEKKEEEKTTATIQEYRNECDKYKSLKKSLPKKGAGREEFTLNLLAKFKERLNSAKNLKPEEIEGDKKDVEEIPDMNDEKWMTHKLHFKDDAPVLAKDANRKGDDWFEIYDPRNVLNKRRRGESTKTGSTAE